MDATHGAGQARSRRKAGPHSGSNHSKDLRTHRPEALYGALDLGTNNCRLLIATPADQGFVVVDAFSRIVRLGEQLGQTGRLSDAAMSRTIDALRVCANKLKWRKVTKSRLIATEACRMAGNGADFIARVEAETGLALEIIDRETEAHLAAVGAEPLVEAEAETALVFDIGGGSTEVMWLQRKGRALRDRGLDIAGGGRGDHLGALRRRHGRDARVLRGHVRLSAADAAGLRAAG